MRSSLRRDLQLRLSAGNAGSGSTPAPPAIPTSGLLVWVRADDGAFSDTGLTTPATIAGTLVAGLQDFSPNVNNATQATSGSRPRIAATQINGRNCIQTPGGSEFLTFGAQWGTADAYTLYLVGMSPALASQGWLGFEHSANLSYLQEYNASGAVVHDNGSQFVFVSLANLALNTPTMIRTTRSLGTYKWKSTGVGEITTLNGLVSTLTFDRFGQGLANGSSPQGSVGEAIFYNRLLTAPETTQVENYLLSRWALSP